MAMMMMTAPGMSYGEAWKCSYDIQRCPYACTIDQPGIELCRVLNMEKEAEERDGGDGGATNDRGSPNDGPRMDELYMLLLSALRQPRDGVGHHISTRVLGIHHRGVSESSNVFPPRVSRAVGGVSSCTTGALPNVLPVDGR
jgi:hypothetical protein